MTTKQPNKLPTWLEQPNQLTSQPQRHNFLAHNQQHLQHLLARLSQPLPAVQSKRWQLSPSISLIRLGILILLIALTNNTGWLWVLGLLLAGHLLQLSPSQLRRFGRSWLLSTLIALLVVLPSYWLVGPATVLLFGFKTGLILASTQYYRLTTTFQELLSGLKTLHCPNIFIMTLAIAITYLRMLGHYLLQTMMALDMRMVAPAKHPYRLIGTLFGNLFLKSHAYALELYAAMEARGFNGHYVNQPATTNRWHDVLTLTPYLVLVAVFIFGRTYGIN